MSNPEHLEIVLKGAEAISSWRSKSSKRSFSISKSRIQNEYASIVKDVDTLNLEDADLQGCNLSGAQLWYTNLINANLAGACLVGADLRYALLIGANLEGATLSEADLTKAVLIEAKLANSDLVKANLANVIAPKIDLSFSRLDNATLDHAFLEQANLRKATLAGASLLGCKLDRCILNGAILERAILQNASLYEAELQEANLDSADVRWANLSAANFGLASLRGANLEGAIIVWPNSLYNGKEANPDPAFFFGADITNANLQGIFPPDQIGKIKIMSSLRTPKVSYRSERVRKAQQATREQLILRTAEGELDEGLIESSLIRLDTLWEQRAELGEDLQARVVTARKKALSLLEADTGDSFVANPNLGLLSVFDVDLLGLLQAVMKGQTQSSIQIEVPESPSPEILHRFVNYLKAEIRAIAFDNSYKTLILATPIAKSLGIKESAFPQTSPLDSSLFSEKCVSKTDGKRFTIEWHAEHIWPEALGTYVQCLSNFFFNSYINLEKKYQELGIHVSFIPDTCRTLPRKIFERLASMGECETGHVEAPYFLQDLVVTKYLQDADKNRAALQEIGYSPLQVQALHEGHLIGIPFDEIGVRASTLGVLPIDEKNVANLQGTEDSLSDATFLDGWVLDSMYNSAFMARDKTNLGLYGSKDVFRDHFAKVHAAMPPQDHVRVKHYAIPVYDMFSIDELQKLVNLIGPGTYFRGQNRGYSLDRPPLVGQLMYGSATVVEPSLITADGRHGVNYDHYHSGFQLVAQSILYQNAPEHQLVPGKIREQWREMAVTGTWDAAVMALGQHYGIPTPGLDVTTSLEVAIWFATNEFTKIAEGQARYVPLLTNALSSNPASWPTIYIFHPVTWTQAPSIQPIYSIEKLGLDAVRPNQQAAFFFMGGHGTHLNRAAEALVAIVRLGPVQWSTGLKYRKLFPPPELDPAYRYLLEAKSRYQEHGVGEILSWVVEYVD